MNQELKKLAKFKKDLRENDVNAKRINALFELQKSSYENASLVNALILQLQGIKQMHEQSVGIKGKIE